MDFTVVRLLSTLKEKQLPGFTASLAHDGRYLQPRISLGCETRLALAPFRFHDLRHTFASRLAMQGANDRTLMALGGWKSPAMLSRYAHLSPSHLWQAVEGLTQSRNRDQNRDRETDGDREETAKLLKDNGEPAGTRTQDPRLKRAMLYRLSYRLPEQRVEKEPWRRSRITRPLARPMKVLPVQRFLVRRRDRSGFLRMIVSSRFDPVEIISIRHSANSSTRLRYRFASLGSFL